MSEKKEKKFKLPNRNGWITSKLRFISLRWPARTEALKRARIERGLYQCAMCKQSFKAKQVHVDHIEPVVPLNNDWGWMEIKWDIYIPRLLCEVEQFQILCTTCHDCKTQIEDQMRVKFREKKKLEKKGIKK